VPVGVGPALWEPAQRGPLDHQRVSHPRAQPTHVPLVGHLDRPGVSLGLQVGQVAGLTQRRKRRLQVADRAFDTTLAFRETGSQHHRPQPQRPVQGGDLGDQPHAASPAAGHDGGVVVADDRAGQAAEALQAADQRRAVLGRPAGQGEHHPQHRRTGQRGHQPKRLAGAALADRDPEPAVPPVDLRELARQVAGALIAGRGHKDRADLAQMVLQDRQRARISLLAQLPSDHRGRHLGVLAQHRGDLVGERIQFGTSRPARIPRRSV